MAKIYDSFDILHNKFTESNIKGNPNVCLEFWYIGDFIQAWRFIEKRIWHVYRQIASRTESHHKNDGWNTWI